MPIDSPNDLAEGWELPGEYAALGAPGRHRGGLLVRADSVLRPPLWVGATRPEPPGPGLRRRRTRRPARLRSAGLPAHRDLVSVPDDHRGHSGLHADLGEAGC